MMTYFIKSAICLGLLLAFYHLVLEREKMHKFNRFFLLGCVLFSFLAPLYTIYTQAVPQEIIETVYTPTFSNDKVATTKVVAEKPVDYTIILITIYLFISGIFTVRFLRNFYKINQKIKKNETVVLPNATLILVDDDIVPHSFWKSIFINKKAYQQNTLEPELLTHELTHVTQKHTFDILFLEMLLILFWINPLFILLKKAIQLNHEFLADEKVITTYKNTFQYQHLLLSKAAWKNDYYLASNLNYLVTKKRLKMMTTQHSKTTVLLKKLAVILVLASFIFLFAERVEAQEVIEVIDDSKKEYLDTLILPLNLFPNKDSFIIETIKPTIQTNTVTINDIRLKLKNVNALKINYLKDTIPKKTAATKKQMREYKSKLEAAQKKNQLKYKEVKRLREIYKAMSDQQKKSVKNVNDILPPPQPKLEKSVKVDTPTSPPPPKPDWVFTYNRLAHRIQRTSDNRKANLIYLEEIYHKKMNSEERKKVTKPDKLLNKKKTVVIENFQINDINSNSSKTTIIEDVDQIIETIPYDFDLSKISLNEQKEETISYFLDNKKINKNDLYRLEPKKIKSIYISRNIKEKSIHVISKKKKYNTSKSLN